jgi:hypothetical protein
MADDGKDDGRSRCSWNALEINRKFQENSDTVVVVVVEVIDVADEDGGDRRRW